MPAAEIITIGTELLLGETVDTNTRFIARALRGMGMDLYRTLTVGDNPERIAQAIREAVPRADVIITTGGLGPTVDDPTRQAVAQAAEMQLEYHPELWEQIAARIARYGRTPTENQKRQAFIPKGAIVIENPVGTAPAFIAETGRSVIISLPGVPREMETLLTQSVIPYLQERFGLHEIIKVRTLHASGVGEAWLDEQVGDLETLANPTVGLTAHSGIVSLRIAAKAETEAEADHMIARIEQEVRSRLGDNLYGSDDDTLEGITLGACARRGWTVACLEVGMDGTLLARLSRAGHPAYLGGSSSEVRTATLASETKKIKKRYKSSAALGVQYSMNGEAQEITLALTTPHLQEERHLQYGGHPKNAPRWAANMAIDWLRRVALESG